jgi:hypothetical protein
MNCIYYHYTGGGVPLDAESAGLRDHLEGLVDVTQAQLKQTHDASQLLLHGKIEVILSH